MEITEEDFKDPYYFQYAYLNQLLHPKQIEVVRSPAKFKTIKCGRRAGKTQLIAGELVRGSVLKLYRKQILIAPSYKQCLIVFDKILLLMEDAGRMDDIRAVVRNPRPKIIFKNKYYIDFGSADQPDTLRGEGYDRIFLDEAGFIKDEALLAIRPLMFDVGAPIWKTSTPWIKNHFYNDWIRGKNGVDGYASFEYDYRDNPYLLPEGKAEIEKDIMEYGRDSLYVKVEIFGEFPEEIDVYFSIGLLDGCCDEYKMIEYSRVI